MKAIASLLMVVMFLAAVVLESRGQQPVPHRPGTAVVTTVRPSVTHTHRSHR